MSVARSTRIAMSDQGLGSGRSRFCAGQRPVIRWIKGDGLFFPAGASYPMLIDPQQKRRCMEDLPFVSDIE